MEYSSSYKQDGQSQSITFISRPSTTQFNPLLEWGQLIFLIVAIYVLVNLLSVRFIVEGPSMQETFHGDDYLIVNRLSYVLGSPQRGDVVVFHYPPDPEQDYIKRVIGIPGDQVEIKDTQVFVNGQQLIETYIPEACTPMSCRDNIWQLGEDEYFVMGDNRNHSSDSRVFNQPVKRQHIVGKVVFRYWPLDVAGFISNGQ